MVHRELTKSESIKMGNIAFRFTDLKRLRKLINENPEHEDFLEEFKEMPLYQLEKLGVSRALGEIIFYLDPKITLEFLEEITPRSNRRTKIGVERNIK
jgi:hypothetical protein